ncbi:mucin-2-like [Macrosteles quadrilineatus]|uniref:mucin-2-like n=1 Tax=Macrosteles quadrilineatus TaxID=74068 RepID=UPI0023E09820|nr:mucin-2-like [Macrosteles quadrilineatus]XP_054285825.1 mucin-2-like [Macrosteles quadrilineatus]XP_054285827.1 mucin-2-like [Macrosteles quadrilineatus]
MCDQTEVTYSPGDVVWVKLGSLWWPSQVQDYDKLPEEITHDLRKRPIAVVKFFQEDSYEYVKNLNQIYHYNCRRKEEFIKKGLDMVRSSNTREVPSNMSMFPNDIVMAEHITGGDPNILESEAFAPEEKTNYSDLFGSAKKSSGKKGKAEALKKEFRRHSESPVRNNRKSFSNLPATIPRPITHPRFITKALEGKSDHEVRIRCQISLPRDDEEDVDMNADKKKYKCHLCDFQSARLNVIVLHNKSHSAGFIEAQNSIKAKLKGKERERVSVGPISLGEQTPTSVTSRGRVKSLPKKLMDYTDEPPPKMLKERTYGKPVKEETTESPTEILVEKSPKKQKVVSEKTAVKRPLFGKRKSAKEKAEIAAKIKQENEAMKETLLKDWDDDDVNEEEVELERLKQALESTTTSSLEDDEIDSPAKIKKTVDQEKTSGKSKTSTRNDSSSSKTISDDVKTKVFEFDDSEDCLPVNINFRLKNKQEKFTDDKFKKPRPPKPLSKPKSKSLTPPTPPPPLFSEKKDEEKDTADLTEAFNALLEETSVPVLPEIPNASASVNSSFSDQTSDISSSTDLVRITDTSGDSGSKMILDYLPKESVSVNSESLMECTSSDNEEVNTSDKVDISSVEDLETSKNQKNMMEVSAVPSAETDSEVLSSGDASTTRLNLNSQTEEPIPPTDGKASGEDSTSTEITSTCEGSKGFLDRKDQPHVNNCSLDESTQNKTDNTANSSHDDTHTRTENVDTPNKSHDDASLVNDDSSSFELNSKILTESKISDNESVSGCQKYDSELRPDEMSVNQKSESTPTASVESEQNVISDPVVQDDENKVDISTMDTDVKKEIPTSKETKVLIKEEHCISGFSSNEQLVTQDVVSHSGANVQIIVPSNQDSNTGSSNYHQQQVETILMPDQGSTVNQTMSQSLQDMELDINSMPVIIGGEDFIQSEQPKPHLIPIQPKYSESIVISPKVNVATSSKPESVVHFSEPSSSTQNIKSVVSLPGKGGKGGGRGGRSPKVTSKTIKLSASALKNLGSLPKGGNQQVLILKTASSKDSQDKGTIQKTQGPLNLIQHGNKILIVNNPQMTGQNKIKLNPQQQQLLTGGKLAPGTRVFTSKVVATTTPPSNDSNKTSTSRPPSKTTQKLVISKGGVLTNVSKSVIINNSSAGKIISTVSGLKNLATSKGQTIVAHNILNTKGGLIIPSSSQNVSSSNKTTTLITSQSLPSSKGMILTPIASKGGQIISGNSKLRIVSSKAPLSGTRFVVQGSPKKPTTVDTQSKGQQIKLISGLRGQSSGNTIFIQTSQGLVAKTISSNTVAAATTTKTITATLPKSIAGSITSPTKIRMSASPVKTPIVIQQPQSNVSIQQIVQQPVSVQPSSMVKVQHSLPVQPVKIQPMSVQPAPTVKKVTAPKSRQSPNILQKPPRKSTPRAPKGGGPKAGGPKAGGPKGGGRSKAQSATKKSEPLILSTSTSLPVITQPSLVQAQIPQNSDGMLYLTIDESGNYRQIDSKSLLTLEGGSTDTPQTIYIPASSQPQDVGNVFLTIDDAGMTQLVNIAPPTSSTSFNQETPAPAQDILAKALANTQVFQQETIMPDVDVSSALVSTVDSSSLASASFVEQPHYPAPSLSHSVQETSLTLTQPIMTPLEVPSNVSPSLGQISALPSNYISSNLLNTKQKGIHPSMPLLTEESLTSQTRGEPIFLLDSSNNIIPLTSGSQTSFQLTLDDSMVTMTSGASGSVLPQTYQVVTSDLLTSQLITQGEKQQEDASQSMHFTVLQEANQMSSEDAQTAQGSGILREALEAPQTFKSESFTNSVETTQSENLANSVQIESTDIESCRLVDFHPADPLPEHISNEQHLAGEETVAEEAQHSLKRSLGEEETVTSSSDHQDDAKRIRLEER